MKELFKITISLTAVCIGSAILLGAVFAKTEHARKEIEEKQHQETIQSLLGFGPGKTPPADLRVMPVYRYVVKPADGKILLGYLIPTKDKSHVFAEIDLEGKPGTVTNIAGDPIHLAEKPLRDQAILSALPKGTQVTFAETLFVADIGDKRLGYVLPGVTQGFKTFIKMMVSLDPDFTVTGIAITESEEDPGLGAEIQKDFFRNQFVGKTLDILKNLKVVKEPLPEDYLPALDPEVRKRQKTTPEQVKEIRQKHLKDDIYALTGATISTQAVTNGVKETVRKFVYRYGILSEAVKQKNIAVAF